MTSIQKATLFVETFGWGCIPSDPSYIQLTLSFVEKRRWLNEEEQTLLKMLGAMNVHSNNENLNTACCGEGDFRFEDDEGEDTLPIPQPSKSIV